MAFMNKKLAVIAYANGWTMWQYDGTHDTTETIRADDYFEPLDKLGNTGDLIVVVGQKSTYLVRLEITPDGVAKTLPMGA